MSYIDVDEAGELPGASRSPVERAMQIQSEAALEAQRLKAALTELDNDDKTRFASLPRSSDGEHFRDEGGKPLRSKNERGKISVPPEVC